MQTKRLLGPAVALTVALSAANAQAQPSSVTLFDFGLNIDGTTWCDLGPCTFQGRNDLSGVPGVNAAGFDFSSGLGSIEVLVAGGGPHTVDLFLDHQIDVFPSIRNEIGSVGGSAPEAGLHWEIDDPFFGNIFYSNLTDGNLDDTNSGAAPSDVSMALGFDFLLADAGTATVRFLVSELMPSGFFLSHVDPDTSPNQPIYFSASIDIATVPAPASALLLAVGLAASGASARRGVGRA